ncbi:uncharacterized protein LOC130892658 [Diorhabda carinulata]|uniref:uncharacterized protein LOC130892658 n=1 Tax=Diorhabda carinulata TaxID=1163345 RepID=UPI0025A0C7A9|nr:uncharacterized protein LOC130892658 [Diorhabda carinulata]
MLIGHRPFQNLFGHADASSETTSENGPESSRPGIFNNIISSFTNILPSPQDVGQGLGNGIASFIQTIPQIGQSFQSLLPDLNNFQLPFFGGSTAQNFPNPITNVNNGLPSDEFKPVNENHDPVTDPYKNRFQHGYYRNYEQSLNGDSYKKENINEERSLNPQSANVQQKVHVNRIRFPS